jgi:TetR/AcrR family transcriptional repressor of nem operon
MASTRQRLIDTALHLVTKRSYQTVSVDDICAAANVNKGSLYHFFPTKMALVAAGLQQESRASKEFYEEIFSGRGDCIARFDRFAERLYDKQFRLSKTYGRVCGCTVTALASELAGQDDAIGALCCDLLRHQERCLEIALREMVAEQMMPASTDSN